MQDRRRKCSVGWVLLGEGGAVHHVRERLEVGGVLRRQLGVRVAVRALVGRGSGVDGGRRRAACVWDSRRLRAGPLRLLGKSERFRDRTRLLLLKLLLLMVLQLEGNVLRVEGQSGIAPMEQGVVS